MTQEKMHLTVNNEIPKMNTTVAITLINQIQSANLRYTVMYFKLKHNISNSMLTKNNW